MKWNSISPTSFSELFRWALFHLLPASFHTTLWTSFCGFGCGKGRGTACSQRCREYSYFQGIHECRQRNYYTWRKLLVQSDERSLPFDKGRQQRGPIERSFGWIQYGPHIWNGSEHAGTVLCWPWCMAIEANMRCTNLSSKREFATSSQMCFTNGRRLKEIRLFGKYFSV